eukprot:scaffold16214_cov73-Phaeocystis_antarctica.AAC.1
MSNQNCITPHRTFNIVRPSSSLSDSTSSPKYTARSTPRRLTPQPPPGRPELRDFLRCLLTGGDDVHESRVGLGVRAAGV